MTAHVPGVSLDLSLPGKYEKLLDPLSVHRWYMGEQQSRADIPAPVSFTEAVQAWYLHVYIPLVEIIRTQKILEHFPDRTETDLYLWILDHRSRLEAELGWNITPETAATDFIDQQNRRVGEELADAILPDPLETGPEPGRWRRERLPSRSAGRTIPNPFTFTDILVPVGASPRACHPLDQPFFLAKNLIPDIHRLHVVTPLRVT